MVAKGGAAKKAGASKRPPGRNGPARKRVARKGAAAKRPPPKPKLAVIKTKETSASVTAFLDKLSDDRQRRDSLTLVDMMRQATGEEPKMWGTSIVGFGNVRITSPATGRQVDWLRIGFAPRKGTLSLYLTGDIRDHAAALQRLGKHKTGKGCLYVKTLDDVDAAVLRSIIADTLRKGHVSNG